MPIKVSEEFVHALFPFNSIEEHITQRFSPPPSSSFNTLTNPETSSNPFDTYDISTDIIQTVPAAPPLLKSFFPPSTTVSFNENSPIISSLFTVQKPTTSIDNEDNTQNVIMNHLHSVKSLKKFFETKMVVQQTISSVQTPTTIACSQPLITMDDHQKFDRSSMMKEQIPIDELEQRQEMMDKVLESLKKKKAYSRITNGKNFLSIRSTIMEVRVRGETLTNINGIHHLIEALDGNIDPGRL